MRDLVQKLPSGNPQRDVGTSDDTIAAVLATLNEVIKKHPEFSRYRITSPFFLFLFSFFLLFFFFFFFIFSSSFFGVVDFDTDPDLEVWPNLDPDPGLCYQF